MGPGGPGPYFPYRENSRPNHKAAWEWVWKLGWSKGMVQVTTEEGTTGGQARGLLAGLGVSGHSRRLLSRTSLHFLLVFQACFSLSHDPPGLASPPMNHAAPLVSVACYQQL